MVPNEKQAVSLVAELLSELLGDSAEVQVQRTHPRERFDFAIQAGDRCFLAEYKRNASAGSVAQAIDALKRYQQEEAKAGIPLIIVPFMGQIGRQLCDRAEVAWLDLCGNAKIIAPGLRVWIEGRPNKYTHWGRPPNLFAAKSSRIARQLLLAPDQFQAQSELARRTGLGDGYVSKIVRRLKQEHYLETNDEGAIRPRDPNLLLDAWHDAYDFDHHRIVKGHVPARSGEEQLHRVVQALVSEKLEWAVTGLSAAWLYTRFAAFRLTTIYLSAMPSRSLLERIEFADEPKGANLWLVLPNDEGVFHGSRAENGIPCVSPLQTYLDLKGHPERANDAAVELRRNLLDWGRHGA